MVKTRQLLWIFLLCSLLVVRMAHAQTTLTQIRDTVVNPDGTSFNGTAVITWTGFSGSGSSGGSPLSTSARIYNGALSVLLVPTTTAASGTFYQVVYYNNAGTVTWTETWQVAPSTTPLTLSAVRTSTTEGATSPSGNGGSSGGGSTTPTGVQYATLPISMNQVSNLSAALASINASIAALSAQVSTGNTGSPLSTSAAFVDAEFPSGAINGSNTTFTLAAAPSPVSGLSIFRNGLLQSPGVDYTLSGSTITFLAGSTPRANDVVTAYYRVPGVASMVAFVDYETPSGSVNGTNLAFTLANAPSPASSLKLFKNGVLLNQNSDYTVSGAIITFVNTVIAPQTGDTLIASYRH